MTEINKNILEGHYSTEIKVKRPKITVAEAPAALPKHTLFLKKKQSKRLMQSILTFTKVQKRRKQKMILINHFILKFLEALLLQPQALPVLIKSEISLENLN